ncbi:MAG TPA: hypothetical protein VH333_14870 [Pseudonocardiaceae bacterium]|nr:hypothetical protein [Pseudonocardiaceae bacterium]
MRKSVLAAVVVLVSTTIFGGSSAFAASAGTPVTVAVNPANGGRVGAGFAGFSYEKDRVGADVFDAHDTNLVRLFRRLGPSVIRIGGNLVDIVNWNAAGAGGSDTEVAPSDVVKLAGFLKATGWKVIYGINLKTNTAANAASEARFASRVLGKSLLAFEIGNEPNFYDTQAQYEASFDAYVSAIRAVSPHAVFDGPGQGDQTDWVGTFAQDEKANGLTMLTTHFYIGANTAGTIPGMLASTASGRLPATESLMDSARSAAGIAQWRMTETNSYFHGGTAGVSDVQAAALWSLDYMAGIAANDGAGINFHGGTSSQFPLNYTPIVYSGITPTGVQGIYYGELLWVLAGTGAYHSATVTGGSNVTAWGVGRNVFVDNEGTSAITTTITLPARAHRADEYVMTAPTLASPAVTIAGSGVGVNGAFHPKPQRVRVAGTKAVIDVPAGSAALLVLS